MYACELRPRNVDLLDDLIGVHLDFIVVIDAVYVEIAEPLPKTCWIMVAYNFDLQYRLQFWS